MGQIGKMPDLEGSLCNLDLLQHNLHQVDVSAANRKTFTTGGTNQSEKRHRQSTGQTRTYRQVAIASFRVHGRTERDHLTPLHLLTRSHICEPRRGSTVFRDQLYKHIETVPPGDFDAFTNKLIQAGSTLEFLKYADPLFEILFAGGLLQPGGNYIDDGSPVCPWAIVNAKEPASAEELKKYIDVQNKLIRR